MIDRCLTLLNNWAGYAERDWYDIPGSPGLGCYGTGYNSWGVQTNQKYLSAMAVLAAQGQRIGADTDRARSRALAALRFSLASHVSGDLACTDGTQWGNTWISALGIERMMHGVHLLADHHTDTDRAAIRRMLNSESDWLLSHYGEIGGGLWATGGRNKPESNIWNGAILWRTAAMYPDAEHAGEWRERAHRFMINGVSIPADETDDRVVAGRPIREWFAGANFFPHYALDHHGYLNVGYMVICASNAAMLHFDSRLQRLAAPESLHHHQADLWQVLRRLVFSDGRLARIGGDTRVRYAYCQEYLLPALLYAADHLADGHTVGLVQRALQWTELEATHNGDGSFYSARLDAHLARQSPYYTTRLESDRACALGMVAAYLPALEIHANATDAAAFEQSVAGHWMEPEHGAVMHRGPTRLASFSWRAHELAQGMCQPPDDGHLAEWSHNLAGYVRFMGEEPLPRKVLRHHIETFDGGFATCGAIVEGADLHVLEGWRGQDLAVHQIAFVALPDGHTVVGLQLCRASGRRVFVTHVKGLQLNVPNDLFNACERALTTAGGQQVLQSPAATEQVIDLGSVWASIDDKVGVVALYGGTLQLHRAPQRRGGKFHTLHVEEICLPCRIGPQSHDPGAIILDSGWMAVSGLDAAATRTLAERNATATIADLPADVRGVQVEGADGKPYVVVANFSDREFPAGRKSLPPGQAHLMEGRW